MHLEDNAVSISAVAKSLLALEAEIAQLEEDAALMHRRLALITTKQRICTAALIKLSNAVPNIIVPSVRSLIAREYFHD